MIKKLLILTALTLPFSQFSKATVRYVNLNATGINNGTSWTDAFTSLQSGIAASITGDSIWVANGVYKPINVATPTIGNREISFTIPSGVQLFGGFAGNETNLSQRNFSTYQTILSGDIGATGNNTDNTFRVVRMTGVSSLTRLDGFKIINGKSTFTGVGYDYQEGAGLYNNNGSPTIINCLFSDNVANSCGALRHTGGGNITIRNCTFQYNNVSGYGGAVGIAGGTATIAGSIFNQNQANYGGALYLSSGVTTIDRCDISGNTATTMAGALYEGDNATIAVYNTLIAGNTAADRCVTYVAPLSNTNVNKWINCTIVDNKATSSDPNDYSVVFSTASEVRNCILWGNATGSGRQMYANCTVANNLVQGGIIVGTSTNTYTFQPRFVNPGMAVLAPFNASVYDYRLEVVSQAIDTGVTSALSPVYTLDLAGGNRNWGGKPDLGCYEAPYCALTPGITPGGNTNICVGQTVVLTATGGSKWQWSTGDSTVSVNAGSAGNYSVIVGNAAGCRGIARVAVTVNQPTVSISGANIICPGGSTTLTAMGNAISYLWSTGASTSSISVTAAGTYSLTGTDNFGCTKTTSISLTTASVPSPVIIAGPSGIKTSQVFASYEWYLNGTVIPGAASQDYTPLTNGSYTVKVTNAAGCSGTSSAYVMTNVAVASLTETGGWSVFPNPAADYVQVSSKISLRNATYRIVDMAGRTVVTGVADPIHNSCKIQTASLNNGFYILQVNADQQIYRAQLMIRH